MWKFHAFVRAKSSTLCIISWICSPRENNIRDMQDFRDRHDRSRAISDTFSMVVTSSSKFSQDKIFSLYAPFLVRSLAKYPRSRIASVAAETRRCSAYRLPREAQPLNGLKRWRGEDWGRGWLGWILSEQLNDYRKICWRSDAIPKDGRVSTPPCELFNSSETKFHLPSAYPSSSLLVQFSLGPAQRYFVTVYTKRR